MNTDTAASSPQAPPSPTILTFIWAYELSQWTFVRLQPGVCCAGVKAQKMAIRTITLFSGKSTVLHKSTAEKAYFVSKGILEVLVLDADGKGEWYAIIEGGMDVIPAGKWHAVRVSMGDFNQCKFFVVLSEKDQTAIQEDNAEELLRNTHKYVT